MTYVYEITLANMMSSFDLIELNKLSNSNVFFLY